MVQSPRFVYEAVTLVEVLDGDSVNLIIDTGFRNVRCKWRDGKPLPVDYRLSGINTKNKATPEGKAARDALEALVTGVQLRVETLKDPEKYGRYMAIIEALVGGQWINVNEAMLTGGYAVPYFGVGKADP